METQHPQPDNVQLTGSPENMGRMNDPDGAAFIKGICGDTMEMYLVISDGHVRDSLFFTDGCSSSLACGSMTAKLAKGRSIRDVMRISAAEVMEALGDVPGLEVHCSILAVMTLYKALADYLLRCEGP